MTRKGLKKRENSKMKIKQIAKKSTVLAIGIATLGTGTSVLASTWIANTPESIAIVAGQKSYTIVEGDTLWAIGIKINVNVETLAAINNIDLSKGEEYHLAIGTVITWDASGNLTAKTPSGNNINPGVNVNDSNKIVSNKPVGEDVSKEIKDDKIPDEQIKGDGNVEMKPIVPNDPNQPNNGGDVEKPTTPNEPNRPVTPNIPWTPIEPGTPVKPEENPEIPDTPIEPGTPVTPENPEIPGTPIEPGTPVAPENPEIPWTPIEPGTPVTPENPEIPWTPIEPGTPVDPGTPPILDGYTVWFKGYDTNEFDIVAGKHVFATKAEAKAWLDQYSDELLLEGNAAGEYGIEVWSNH